MTVNQVCVTDAFAFDENHVRDLFHTAVPVAYADRVFLDPHFANQTRQKLKLGPPFFRVYTHHDIERFLTGLADSEPSRGYRPTPA